MIRRLLLISTLLSLTACAGLSSQPQPRVGALLAPTEVEDRYPTMKAVMADPQSTTRDALRHGQAADDALGSCNADKHAALDLLGSPSPSCPWWKLRCPP